MAVPITTYLNYARICQYLAADGNSQTLLFKGGGNRPNQSALLNIVRNIIQWQYSLDPNDADLPKMTNYLFSLCNPYVHDAINIINSGSSGNIVNPSTGGNVTIATPSYQFKIGEVGSLMNAGDTTLTINLAGVVNPSIEITLDGVEMPYGRNDVISYTATYNPTNVALVFNEGAITRQLYMIRMIQLIPV